MRTRSDRLVFLIGNAGGQKRIPIAKSRKTERGHIMVPVRMAQELFLDDLAECDSEPHKKGDQYAIATLTDKGKERYEKIKTSKLYK
jgi:hypothetical protein